MGFVATAPKPLEMFVMKLMTKKEVCALVRYSPAHIDRMERDNRFPLRIRLSNYRRGRVVWREDAVLQWLQERFDKSQR
jgi:prophage regulatory protein